MITAIKNIDMLIDGVLDNGLVFIGDYLEKVLQHSIIIADPHGRILYPDKKNEILSIDFSNLFINTSELTHKKEYCYIEEDGNLYYFIEANHQNAYVIVEGLKAEIIPRIIAILRESRLALKCYFSKMNNNTRFEKELTEYLFCQSHANFRDILLLNEVEMDINRPYFVLILQAEEGWPQNKPTVICSYASEYLKREKLKFITVFHHHQLAFIIPVNSKKSDMEINSSDNNFDIAAFKKMIDYRFNITTSIGTGRVYALIDLEKSFNEARIAIILSNLLGRPNVIQKFSDLGIYHPIFSQEIKHIHEYCNNILGRLIEHDCKNDGELLPTLRKLLDACVNIKATADRLFIHVNTLYYRINKIEQILNIDLAKMETRVELYTAIKVWDTLQILNGAKDSLTTPLVPTTGTVLYNHPSLH
jgi:hypothetical protein